MAEEEMGDKTEAPTPRRRQEAREQGNVARSADLSSAVLMLGMLLILNWYGSGIVTALRNIMGTMLAPASLNDFSPYNAIHGFGSALTQVGRAMAPLFVGAVLIAIVVNMAQVGLNFNTKKLQPNLMALNPLKGLGKMFKGGQGGVMLVMNLLKLTLVGWVAYSAVGNRIGEIVMSQGLEFLQIFSLGCSLVYAIGVRIAVVLLILAILDYAWQKYRIEQELKMSKQEIKEEMRRMEGDPKIKQRRRQIAQQQAVQRFQKDVPNADVVVTNPTHFAIALQYDQANMGAPKVIAKGQDFLALKIREIAAAAGVPILERPPLARSLYKLVEVGQEIPEQFYSTVAEILAYVYELTGKTRQKSATGGRQATVNRGAAAAGVN
jgi:flagellar biosynthetic protein FlhB